MLEMNLGQIGTNDFYPTRSSRRKRKAPAFPSVQVLEIGEQSKRSVL